jgi:hypothetical protein
MVYTLNGLNSLPEVLKILEMEYKTTSGFTRGEIEDRVFIALVDPSRRCMSKYSKSETRVANR